MGGVGGIVATTNQRAGFPGVPLNMWDQGFQGMSEQALAERRLRNREHAKRSRVRKKFMLESLQEEVRILQKENEELRLLVQGHIPEKAQEIIAECCMTNPLFSDAMMEVEGEDAGSGTEAMRASLSDEEGEGGTTMSTGRKSTPLVKADFSLMSSLSSSQQNFVLTDPRLPDNPIVFASPGFYSLTGFTSKEVLGRNCRFLQGPGTDIRATEVVRKAVQTGSDATVCFLNYKADGTPFWNQLYIAALRDSENSIVNFVGVQCEVEPEAGGSALEDRVNAVLPLQNKEDENNDA